MKIFLKSCVSIGVALAVLYIIVLPKILRALSGQEVIVSNILGSKLPNSSEATSTTNETKKSSGSYGDNVMVDTIPTTQWNYKEALPKHIEEQIMELHMMFRGVANKW